MNRRSFFKRTLGAIATAALAPMIPSLQPSPIQLFGGEPIRVITWTTNMFVLTPRMSKMITNIEA